MLLNTSKNQSSISNRKKSARWLPDSYLTIVNGHANINQVEDFAVELKVLNLLENLIYLFET